MPENLPKPRPTRQLSLPEFMHRFPDDDTCLAYLFQTRYGSLEKCPKCGAAPATFYRVKGRKSYACTRCRYQIYPTVGTVMEKTNTRLFLWFYALYLFSVSKHGVNAKELARTLGVTYKTAWSIGQKIRASLIDQTPAPLSGIVQVDETLLGGYRPGKRGWAAENKTCLFGMIEEGGRVRITPVPDRTRETLLPLMKQNIERGSVVNTDEFKVYHVLPAEGYQHRTVNHSKYQWRNGEAHTNCMEGYWSNLKKWLLSTYTYVSVQHLVKYSAEFEFRHNHRAGFVMFEEMMKRICSTSAPDNSGAASSP